MSDFEVRRCRRSDYNEFLDVLNEAFGHSAESHWFQHNINNCTPYPHIASDELIDRHVIAIDGASGEIMGGVGAYPLELIVSEDEPDGERYSLPMIGIGQVCCSRKFRNSGVMTSTLKLALDEAVEAGAVGGFLGGDRFRYGRFGFDYGGGSMRLDFRQFRLKTIVDASKLKVRATSEADISELNAMYETMPSYIKRAADCWKMHFGRSKYMWRIGEQNGEKAYIAYCEPNREIAEICGDPSVALAMILSHMESHGLDRVSVTLPLSPGRGYALAETLRAASSYAHAAPCGMDLISIYKPDVIYNTIKPAIARMGAALDDGDDKTELIKYLFGAPGHSRPASLPAGDRARPLTFWISDVDSV